MAYSINFTDTSKPPIIIADGQLKDDALSIPVWGRDYNNYGALVATNMLALLENFSYSISPPNPISGQHWFNPATDTMSFWSDSSGWIDLQQPLPLRIFNEHISPDAKIDLLKLRPTQPGKIIVGDINASAIPTYVEMTGDVLIFPTGNTKIQNNTINTAEFGNVIDQDQTFGNLSTASNRTFNILAHDSYIATLNLHGSSQGSGMLFVGESSSKGGGIMYNGDNNPVVSGSEDYISHYRRNGGVDVEVFRYSAISDQVDFTGEITTPRVRTGLTEFTFLENNLLQLQAPGSPRIEMRSHDGGLPTIDFSTSLTGDFGSRLQLATDNSLEVYGSDFVVGAILQTQNTSVKVITGNNNIASLEAYGDTQGTGRLYLGKSTLYGGGMIYNGDNAPTIVGTTDNISFYRRSNGADFEVFRYSEGSSDVFFNANVTLQGALFINDTSTRVTEGAGNSVRLQTNSGYIDIGAQNTTWAHIQTDRSNFLFNKGATFSGDLNTNRYTITGTSTYLDTNILNISSTGSVGIELRSTTNGQARIDFSNDGSVDYDARLVLLGNDQLQLYGASLYVDSDLYIGRNGGGDSRIFFYDDNSNTNRLMFWDDSVNDWRVSDNNNITRVLYHSGNLPSYSLSSHLHDSRYVEVTGDAMTGNLEIIPGRLFVQDNNSTIETAKFINDNSNGTCIGAVANASSTNTAVIITTRVNNAGNFTSHNHIRCDYSGTIKFRVRGDGNVYANAHLTPASDYAEYFEWADGNPNDEDRVCFSVVLDNEKIRKAVNSDDPTSILGIVSPVPGVIGDAAEEEWAGKYELDEFGRKIPEHIESLTWLEGEERVWYPLNDIPADIIVPVDAEAVMKHGEKFVANFDPSIVYTPRSQRKEWCPVGLMGKVRLRIGQPTNPNWVKLKNISETVELWLIK